jgi:hypothetical protein
MKGSSWLPTSILILLESITQKACGCPWIHAILLGIPA